MRDIKIKITHILKSEIDEVLELGDIIFKGQLPDNKGYMYNATNWNISVKLTDADKIIGFYLFEENNIPMKEFNGKRGVEGVALGIDSEYRCQGLGNLLIDKSYELFKDKYDYIWGQHLKTLDNLNDWKKKRTIRVIDDKLFISYKFFKTEVRIPLLMQPDGISCGNTCIKMILDFKGIYKESTIGDIVDICGTNREHGTRDVEMLKGLNYFNIPNKQFEIKTNDRLNIRGLDSILDNGDVFVMRTLTRGIKHWIIVRGKKEDRYLVNDPWLGKKEYTEKQIIDIWKPRDFDGFEIFMDKF